MPAGKAVLGAALKEWGLEGTKKSLQKQAEFGLRGIGGKLGATAGYSLAGGIVGSGLDSAFGTEGTLTKLGAVGGAGVGMIWGARKVFGQGMRAWSGKFGRAGKTLVEEAGSEQLGAGFRAAEKAKSRGGGTVRQATALGKAAEYHPGARGTEGKQAMEAYEAALEHGADPGTAAKAAEDIVSRGGMPPTLEQANRGSSPETAERIVEGANQVEDILNGGTGSGGRSRRTGGTMVGLHQPPSGDDMVGLIT